MKRLVKYDNYKAILIILVVLGHLLFIDKYNNIVYFIYSFHMPLFMIISGFFSKKKITINNLIKYIVLLIIMNSSFVLYDYIAFKRLDLFCIKYSSWYLLLIIVYRLLFSIGLNKIVDNHKKAFLITSFILAILVGFINTKLIILRFFEYLFFFTFGYIYTKDIKYDNKRLLLLDVFIILLVFLGISMFSKVDIDFYYGSVYTNNYFVILRSIIYILNIVLFITTIKIIPNKNLIITNFGKQSMYIYVFHRVLTLVIVNLFQYNNYYIFIALISTLIIIKLLSNKYFVALIDTLLHNK